MFQPSAYYTFLFKAGWSYWRDKWWDEICDSRSCLVSFKLWHILDSMEKMWCFVYCMLVLASTHLYNVCFEAVCQTFPFMGRKAVPQADYCTVYDVIQIFALVPFEAPPTSPHVEVRNHTNTAHSATPSKHTRHAATALQSFKTHSALSPNTSQQRWASFPRKSRANAFSSRVLSTLLGKTSWECLLV